LHQSDKKQSFKEIIVTNFEQDCTEIFPSRLRGDPQLIFAAYIDVLLSTLDGCKVGCYLNGQCLNSLLYADDLLLLSISVSGLSQLIKVCKSVFEDLDLQINFEKSCCLRVGSRSCVAFGPFIVDGLPLQWAASSKYLGVNILAKKNLSCDWHPAKRKFFTSINSVLHALGPNPSPLSSSPYFVQSAFPFYHTDFSRCRFLRRTFKVLLSRTITFSINCLKLNLSQTLSSVKFIQISGLSISGMTTIDFFFSHLCAIKGCLMREMLLTSPITMISLGSCRDIVLD